MKWVMACLATFVCVLIIAVCQVSCVKIEYDVQRQTGAWLDRAQVAANATDMDRYLVKTREGMEQYGMTHGYAALIFKKPDNDMALIYEAVVSLEQRAAQQSELLQANPQYATETTYQVALDDLRGAVRELLIQTPAFYWRHDGLWLAVAVTASYVVGLCVICGVWIWAVVTSDSW